MNKPQNCVTVKEFSEMTGYNLKYVYHLISQNKIQVVKVLGRIYIKEKTMQNLIIGIE